MSKIPRAVCGAGIKDYAGMSKIPRAVCGAEKVSRAQ